MNYSISPITQVTLKYLDEVYCNTSVFFKLNTSLSVVHEAKLQKLPKMNILKENKPRVHYDVPPPLIIKKILKITKL